MELNSLEGVSGWKFQNEQLKKVQVLADKCKFVVSHDLIDFPEGDFDAILGESLFLKFSIIRTTP